MVSGLRCTSSTGREREREREGAGRTRSREKKRTGPASHEASQMAMSPAANLSPAKWGICIQTWRTWWEAGREGEKERGRERARTRARGGEGERGEIERSRGGASGGSPGIQPE